MRFGPPTSSALALLATGAMTACAAWAAQAGAPARGGWTQGAHATRARAESARLAYSRASANVVQAQPPAGTCHARGGGLYELPDPRCTPGALNPAVTQSHIRATICASGWTSTVRPRESVSEREKFASLRAYGAPGRVSAYEYDHLVPLELGGAVNDPRNLWPEPDYATREGYYLNPKDHLERVFNRLVCAGEMTLARAQGLIAAGWVSAYRSYG